MRREMLLSLATGLSDALGWPLWTLYTLSVLVCSVMLLSLVSRAVGVSVAAANKKAGGFKGVETPAGFVEFQRKYLAVFLVVMLGQAEVPNVVQRLHKRVCDFEDHLLGDKGINHLLMHRWLH